ncbi:MAG: DUF4124 domain-containing protein [Deltaproteobacteria bacterium]|nr:DUF4124 domain-containing protein [Deltaproteobacteria bacterium]
MRIVISYLSQKPLKILCVFTLIVVFSTTVFVGMSFSEQIYTWVDKNGVVHFTNCPTSLPISDDCKVGTMGGSDYVLPPTTKEHTQGKGSKPYGNRVDKATPNSESTREERRLAIQKAIKDVTQRLNDVQARIDTVISLKGHSLSDIHTEREREERIKANTEQSLERLKSKREILINRLLELQRKLEN